MRKLALAAALVLGCQILAGCIPIGARVQNMYAQAPAPGAPAR